MDLIWPFGNPGRPARADRLPPLRGEWLRLALRITGSSESAEDVVQEAMLRLLRAETWPSHPQAERAYFRRTVVRCALDILAKRQDLDLSSEMPEPTRDPEGNMDIGRTLVRLRPEHQVILALAFGEGLSHKEMAELLDIPMGTVGSRIHAAKAAFRREWEGAE
jgi:RNA polymerase sigma factor (sigma-70 family)